QGGQFVIASHGDSSGHPLKTWSFKYSNGDFSSPGNVIAYSDAKLKKDLEIIPDALEKIDALNGYTYTRIDTGEKQTGVVAQEVQAVLPEAVTKTKTADDEEILGVAYGNMAGLFIEAIKELKKEIKSLKLEVEKLKFKEEK
ncbi:MAG: tail fiber domain-containing protein, partial [Waterburya sp.]